MFKNASMILNPHINKLISQLGHFDEIVICDAGLPIPKNGAQVIDLSIIRGYPSFINVLDAFLNNLAIEELIITQEMKFHNKKVYEEFSKKYMILKDVKEIKPILSFTFHDDFKKRSNKAVAFIRTGEQTPYANIILVAGVNF